MPSSLSYYYHTNLPRPLYQSQIMREIWPSNAKTFGCLRKEKPQTLNSRSNYTRMSSEFLLGNSLGRFPKFSWQTESIRISWKDHKLPILKGHHRPGDSESPGPGLMNLIQEAPQKFWWPASWKLSVSPSPCFLEESHPTRPPACHLPLYKR